MKGYFEKKYAKKYQVKQKPKQQHHKRPAFKLHKHVFKGATMAVVVVLLAMVMVVMAMLGASA